MYLVVARVLIPIYCLIAAALVIVTVVQIIDGTTMFAGVLRNLFFALVWPLALISKKGRKSLATQLHKLIA